MHKIKEITIASYKTEEISVHVVAKIDDEENLVLEGYDIGRYVKEHWGDSDYEYWLRVARDDKDTALLWLIKERFATSSEFKQWLDDKGIPNQFDSWV
ncbi:MAG: hypothetical protein WBV94_19780 [Blastocatellia bacterium]